MQICGSQLLQTAGVHTKRQTRAARAFPARKRRARPSSASEPLPASRGPKTTAVHMQQNAACQTQTLPRKPYLQPGVRHTAHRRGISRTRQRHPRARVPATISPRPPPHQRGTLLPLAHQTAARSAGEATVIRMWHRLHHPIAQSPGMRRAAPHLCWPVDALQNEAAPLLLSSLLRFQQQVALQREAPLPTQKQASTLWRE